MVVKYYQAVSLSMTGFDYYCSFISSGFLTREELQAFVMTISRASCTTTETQLYSLSLYFKKFYWQALVQLDLAFICFMLLILTYRQRYRFSSQSQTQYRHAAHRDRDRQAGTRWANRYGRADQRADFLVRK